MRYSLSEEDWEIALARYQKMPSNMRMHVMGQKLNKQQIVENVKRKTQVGETLTAMQKNYQEWLKRR